MTPTGLHESNKYFPHLLQSQQRMLAVGSTLSVASILNTFRAA